MNGELAQLIALTTRGTAWLRGDLADPGLGPDHSTMRLVAEITFSFGSESTLAWQETSADGWLQRLRRAGVTALCIVEIDRPRSARLPPHEAASRANGGNWGMLARSPAGQQAWLGYWRLEPEPHRGRRIWGVAYTGVPVGDEWPSRQMTPSEARIELTSTLEAARDWAERHDAQPWADRFAEALDTGGSLVVIPPFDDDLLPPDASLERRQLLGMASAAWVFGSTASWTDLSFAGAAQTEYEALTARLFHSLSVAAITAANAA